MKTTNNPMETQLIRKEPKRKILVIQEFCRGEYEIPLIDGVGELEIYDPSSIEEILIHLGIKGTEKELDKAMIKIIKSMLKGIKLPFEIEPWASYTELSFHDPSKERIKSWLDSLESYTIDFMNFAGGDDTFYDYMPSMVEVFAQVCIQLKNKGRYNKMIKRVLKSDPERWKDQNIHRMKI